MNIETVWTRIHTHAGEIFYTKTGIPFSYHVSNKLVVLNNTNRSIPYSDFETALSLSDLRITNLKRLNLQGPSYLYGIITDPRVIAENSTAKPERSKEALAKTFEEELRNHILQAKAECNYNPTVFSHMLNQYGGVDTAKRLIATSKRTGHLSDGYAKLCLLGRLDLTVEASVCKPQYASLFTEDEITYCRCLFEKNI